LRRWLRPLALGIAIAAGSGVAWAGSAASAPGGSLRYCDEPADLSARQKDRLFRFAGIVKAELEASGQRLALIARSGLDLSRFGVRYSHAGLSLKGSDNAPWSVRQLYYACDEQRPRVFDQGLSGFVLGLNDPSVGYVSAVLLPEAPATELERTVLDNRRALQMLSPTYSANAYPFSLSYQNCNQWVMEMLAAAWGGIDRSEGARTEAQRWLKERDYRPSVLNLAYRPLMWLGAFIPWVHSDDHPQEDLAQVRYRVSMPESIEEFVRAQVPGATRVEFCQTEQRVVIRRGWAPIAEGCVAGEQDTVIALD